MSLVEKVKTLCAEGSITIAELERRLDFGNGTIRKWDNAVPSGDRLAKVALFFHVSVDYLLGLSQGRYNCDSTPDNPEGVVYTPTTTPEGRRKEMELNIIGSPEEIAALLLELRRQPAEPDTDTIEFVDPDHAEAPAEVPVACQGGKNLVSNIEAERAREGMTLDEMAKRLGVTRKTVYNWYSKESIPWARLQQIADLFQVNVLDLMGIK